MVEVWDWTGNCISREWRQTVESRKKHRDTGRIWIETDSAPGRTVQGTDYYNTDVRFRLMVEDAWSGLKNLSCTGGTTIDFQEHLAEESGLQERGILYAHSQELLLEKKYGDFVKKGDIIAVLRASRKELLEEASKKLLSAYTIGSEAPPSKKLVYAMVTKDQIVRF